MSKERCCLNCHYAFVEEDHRHLQCRFHAPPVDKANTYRRGWPRVEEDDWCGQFKLDPELEGEA